MTTDAQRLAREEAHHRFLNTLMALQSLLRQDFAGLQDPPVRDAVEIYESQLLAFAAVHRALQNPIVGVIDVPTHFGRLCAQISASQLAPLGLRCEFSADEGEMAPEVGATLGLILVEFLSNAGRQAGQGGSRRRVSVALRWTGGLWVCLVEDDGAGPPGSNLRLIQALADHLEADLMVRPDEAGAQFTLRLPAPRMAAKRRL